MMSVKAWSVGNAAKSKEKQNSKSIRQQQEVQQKKRNIGRNHITRKWRQLKKNRLQTHTDTDTQTDRHTHTDSTHTHRYSHGACVRLCREIIDVLVLDLLLGQDIGPALALLLCQQRLELIRPGVVALLHAVPAHTRRIRACAAPAAARRLRSVGAPRHKLQVGIDESVWVCAWLLLDGHRVEGRRVLNSAAVNVHSLVSPAGSIALRLGCVDRCIRRLRVVIVLRSGTQAIISDFRVEARRRLWPGPSVDVLIFAVAQVS